MPSFPRTILPLRFTRPRLAGPLLSVGQSGKPQVRSTLQVGWSWEETWGVLQAGDASVEAFLAQLENYWRSGTVLDMDHRSKRTLLGLGGGTPQVNGASQTGTTLATKLWPNSTAVLKAGDIFRVAGLNQAFQLTADATSDGAGLASLAICPPIFVGGSPAANAALTINTTPGLVTYRVLIVALEAPEATPPDFYGGLRVSVMETQ